MANICDNELHMQSENPENIKAVEKFFEDWLDSSITYKDSTSISVFFPSPRNFSIKEMEKLAKSLPEPELVTGECLSTEWNSKYTEFHTFEEGVWIAE